MRNPLKHPLKRGLADTLRGCGPERTSIMLDVQEAIQTAYWLSIKLKFMSEVWYAKHTDVTPIEQDKFLRASNTSRNVAEYLYELLKVGDVKGYIEG